MPYSTLRSDAIIDTLDQLYLRINDRFPNSSLGKLCNEVIDIAKTADDTSQQFLKPLYWLRFIWVSTLFVSTFVVTLLAFWLAREFIDTSSDGDVLIYKRTGFELFEGLEPTMNVFVLIGAGLFFMYRFEAQFKRGRMLKHIHKLRSLVHIVDMHQLTKDPTILVGDAKETQNSPTREMSCFELKRYLDYCTELLALIGKISALYMRDVEDSEIIRTGNEIETLSTDISRKVWQKISIIEQFEISKDVWSQK